MKTKKKTEKTFEELLEGVTNTKGVSVTQLLNERPREIEPFDVNYLLASGTTVDVLGNKVDLTKLGFKEDKQVDPLYHGEEKYCRRVEILTKYLRKFGIRGEWTDDETFEIERYIGDSEYPQVACFYVDYDYDEYVFQTASIKNDGIVYQGTRVSHCIEAGLKWLSATDHK